MPNRAVTPGGHAFDPSQPGCELLVVPISRQRRPDRLLTPLATMLHSPRLPPQVCQSCPARSDGFRHNHVCPLLLQHWRTRNRYPERHCRSRPRLRRTCAATGRHVGVCWYVLGLLCMQDTLRLAEQCCVLQPETHSEPRPSHRTAPSGSRLRSFTGPALVSLTHTQKTRHSSHRRSASTSFLG